MTVKCVDVGREDNGDNGGVRGRGDGDGGGLDECAGAYGITHGGGVDDASVDLGAGGQEVTFVIVGVTLNGGDGVRVYADDVTADTWGHRSRLLEVGDDVLVYPWCVSGECGCEWILCVMSVCSRCAFESRVCLRVSVSVCVRGECEVECNCTY